MASIQTKTKTILRASACAATGLFLLFIFGNSLQNGVASGLRSTRAVALLQAIADSLHLPLTVSELVIRKLAHGLEYLVLGMLLSVNIRLLTRNWWARIFVPLFFSLLIPVIDESIQLFSPGRSGEVRDVLIDFGGAAVGILLMTLLLILVDQRKNRKKRN